MSNKCGNYKPEYVSTELVECPTSDELVLTDASTEEPFQVLGVRSQTIQVCDQLRPSARVDRLF